MRERSAEFLRGAKWALRQGNMISLDGVNAMLAQAEAREAAERDATEYRWRQLKAMNAGLLRQLAEIKIACKPENMIEPDGKEWTFHPSNEVVRMHWERLSKAVREAMASAPHKARDARKAALDAAAVIAQCREALEGISPLKPDYEEVNHGIDCCCQFCDGNRISENIDAALTAISAWEAGR